MGSRPILASLDGIATVLGLMILQGAMCEECGHGTRATSKNWARCKKCGHRNRRRTIEEASEMMRAQREGPFYLPLASEPSADQGASR